MTGGNLDILVISAHPDDTEICCGGMILMAAATGKRVGLADLTRGEMGTRGTPETRQQELVDAQEILGAEVREVLDFGDGQLRTGREEELAVIDLIRRHRPRLLVTPWPDERHPDHARTGKLVTDAWFYAGLVKLDTQYQAWRPDAVIYYIQNYVQHPSFVVDISQAFETKMKAIRAYSSQVWDPDSDEPMTIIAKKSFLDLIEARARHFGALIGVEYGEGFLSKQPPRIDDPVAAFRGRESS